ncbi:hypothetical protein [Spongiactinospora sp. 9N601]|uniref:hypothetical protein n=1 Tax=Spongiactinospora sp. 9N601 TaxID=3375149 RepID=UPI0037AF6B12
MPGFTPQDDDLFVVWEVDAGEFGVGGVTKDEVTADQAMFDALESFRHGRGRVRYARLVPAEQGPCSNYWYGTTLVTAHRVDGVTVAVVGDAWEVTL